MRSFALVLVAFSSSLVAHAQSPSAVARSEAEKAFKAKAYAQCAERFLEAASTVAQKRRADMLYSAACCQALDGAADRALNSLDRAFEAGLSGAAQITADTDLASLSKLPRFKALVKKVEARDAQVERATEPALKQELLEMVEVDQAVRRQFIQHRDDVDVRKKMEELDGLHIARMKEIVAKFGWPGQTLVGRRASFGAWLLVQHGDLDLPFQKRALALMEEAAKKHEVSAQHLAYLSDRIAVAEGRPQRYGTQFEGLKPRPIEDEAHVDERRLAIGLETMADYTVQMMSMYGPPQP